MRVLTYKRTHSGDPDCCGAIFGSNNCMGRVRDYAYDAVIGVGGLGLQAKEDRIAGKLNWIGIGPHRKPNALHKGTSEVSFDTFVYFGSWGRPLQDVAPNLARRIYEGRVRYLTKGYKQAEQHEAEQIIRNVLAGRYGLYGQEKCEHLVMEGERDARTAITGFQGCRCQRRAPRPIGGPKIRSC